MPEAAHRRQRSDTRHRWLIAGVVVAAAAVAVATTALVVTKVSPSKASADPTTPAGRLDIMSTVPAPDAAGVPSDTPVSVHFTVALAADTPVPSIVPPVAGSWVQTSPQTLAFDAAAPLPPGAALSVSVPGGPDGVKGSRGQRLAEPLTTHFTVASMSTLRLQQLLADLGYLPLTFTPADPAAVTPNEEAVPQLGSFAWRWDTMPGTFTSLWSPGEPNVVTQGAVMAFESQQHMTADGVAGPQVWQALLQATAADQVDSDGHYDWVDVSTSVPEHVNVWRDGAAVYTTRANTGIQAAPTELGTWPVYVRYTSTTMSGTNPDGSHYHDPGVPWVSYFHGGDALHGFIRSSYGTPQSLGCVEMAPANAAVVYPYTPLGTLVTVQ
ncbi:MAG TPA: L,D-transpeptidase family protein [Acidimicrobiales bacterium]|nr:L,D-transpeptidase family protein [Acidimicrobiales bacterium]